MSKIDEAIAFAAQAHAGQKRKYDGLPYITHPIEVMVTLHMHGIDDEAMLIAAVLHDVIEDTMTSPDMLVRRFGQNVTDLVMELTDVYTHEAFPDMNRAARKAQERLRIAITSPRAQTIKYADFLSNTASITKHDMNFARRYLAEKEAILEVARAGDQVLLARCYAALQAGQYQLMQAAIAPKDVDHRLLLEAGKESLNELLES